MRGGLGRDRALTATIPHHGSCKNLIPCVGGGGRNIGYPDSLPAASGRSSTGPENPFEEIQIAGLLDTAEADVVARPAPQRFNRYFLASELPRLSGGRGQS